MINTDAVLDGYGYLAGFTHRGNAVTYYGRLGHEAGTKPAVLHAVTRATAVQIDLVVTPLFTERRALGEVGGYSAAQLQGHGVFLLVKA